MRTAFAKLVALCCVGGLLLSGFGCKQTNPVPAPITLQYWTVFDNVDELQKLVDQYKQIRPYVNVQIRQLRQDEFYPQLVEALAEDRGPDIVSFRNRSVGELQSKLAPMPKDVTDVTVVVQKGAVQTTTVVTPNVRPMLTPDQLDTVYAQTVKKDVVRDGKIYGLPLSLDTLAVYYNQDLLDRSGVAQLPQTWNDFSAAVKKITRIDPKTGVLTQSGAAFGTGNNMPGSDDILYMLFRQSGVDFVDRSGQAVFNTVGGSAGDTNPVMKLINYYTDFANPQRDTYTWSESMESALNRFTQGSVGFFFGYSYHYPLIKQAAPQLNFGVLPLFQLDANHPVNAADYWVDGVTLKSKHQNEAWALIDYLAHSGATKQYLDATGRPTALRAYYTEQSADPKLGPFAAQILTAENWYHGKNYDAAQKAVTDMIHAWLNPPDPTKVLDWKQEALDRAAAQINQTM